MDLNLLESILKSDKTYLAYYSYPVGTYQSSYLFEDEQTVWNLTCEDVPDNSAVVNLVDSIINTATKQLGFTRDNKTAVKVKITAINEVLYFVSYDLRRVICKEINLDRGSVEYKL